MTARLAQRVLQEQSVSVEPLLEGAFALQELPVNSPTNISVGFGQEIEQAAGTRTLIGFQPNRVETFRWPFSRQPHKEIDVELVSVVRGRKVGSAQFLAGDPDTQGFDNRNARFDLIAGFDQIATVTLHTS